MRQIKLIALVIVAVFLVSTLGAIVGAKPLPVMGSDAHPAGKGLYTVPTVRPERNGGKNPCGQKTLAYVIAPKYSGKVSMPNDKDMERMDGLITKEWNVPPERVFNAREESATTKDAIQTEMNNLAHYFDKEGTTADLVVIYYAGHVVVDKQTGGTFIAPPNAFDAGSTDPEVADLSKCISADDFASWVDAIPSKNTLVIFDACHSDGMVTTTLRGDKYATLASSKVDEKGGGPPGTSGYFTNNFANAFEDPYADSVNTNGDCWISVAEAFHYANLTMAKLELKQHPQPHGGAVSSDVLNLKHVRCDQPSYSQLELVSAGATTPVKASVDHMELNVKDTAVITYQLMSHTTSNPPKCDFLPNKPVTLYYGGYTEPPKCSCDPNEPSPHGKCVQPEPKVEWKEVETKLTDGNGLVEWRYPLDKAGTYYFKVKNGECPCGSWRELQVDADKFSTFAWGSFSHPVAKIKHPCWGTGHDEGYNNTYCVVAGEKFFIEGHLVAWVPDSVHGGYYHQPLGNKVVALWRVDYLAGSCGGDCNWTYVKSATTDSAGYFKFDGISEDISHFKCPFMGLSKEGGFIGMMFYSIQYKPVGDDDKYFACTYSIPNTCTSGGASAQGGIISGGVEVFTDMGCYAPDADPPCCRGLLCFCRCDPGNLPPIVD